MTLILTHSNTTLVKVKFAPLSEQDKSLQTFNTTLVKVK